MWEYTINHLLAIYFCNIPEPAVQSSTFRSFERKSSDLQERLVLDFIDYNLDDILITQHLDFGGLKVNLRGVYQLS